MTNLLESAIKGMLRKRNLLLLAVLFLIGNFWTHSQIILPTDSRNITYEKLGEFAKYVKYKQQADTILFNYQIESDRADSLISVLRDKNKAYTEIITDLKAKNESKDIRLANGIEILKIKEETFESELRHQKGKKWTWGTFGIIIGGLVGFLTAISL